MFPCSTRYVIIGKIYKFQTIFRIITNYFVLLYYSLQFNCRVTSLLCAGFQSAVQYSLLLLLRSFFGFGNKLIFLVYIVKIRFIVSYNTISNTRKGSLHSLHQRFCSCWLNSLPVAEDNPNSPDSPVSPALPSSLTTFSRIAGLEEQRIESIYHRRPSGIKVPVQNCDSRHWEQTRRLEKWHSAHHTSHHPTATLISMQSSLLTFSKEFITNYL